MSNTLFDDTASEIGKQYAVALRNGVLVSDLTGDTNMPLKEWIAANTKALIVDMMPTDKTLIIEMSLGYANRQGVEDFKRAVGAYCHVVSNTIGAIPYKRPRLGRRPTSLSRGSSLI